MLPRERIRSVVVACRRRRRLVTMAEFGFYGAALGAGVFWTLQRFMF
jgi:hypothetical protein